MRRSSDISAGFPEEIENTAFLPVRKFVRRTRICRPGIGIIPLVVQLDILPVVVHPPMQQIGSRSCPTHVPILVSRTAGAYLRIVLTNGTCFASSGIQDWWYGTIPLTESCPEYGRRREPILRYRGGNPGFRAFWHRTPSRFYWHIRDPVRPADPPCRSTGGSGAKRSVFPVRATNCRRPSPGIYRRTLWRKS